MKGWGRGRKSDGVTEIFGGHPHLGLKDNFVFNASIIVVVGKKAVDCENKL